MDKYIRYKINSALFCMAQRAIQENKIDDFLKFIEKLEVKAQ